MYKLFFQIILLHSVVFSHQFFLTTTEVRLSDNQKSLEITIVYGTKTVQSSTMTVEEPAFKFEL